MEGQLLLMGDFELCRSQIFGGSSLSVDAQNFLVGQRGLGYSLHLFSFSLNKIYRPNL